jgi:hypothetical protein
VLDFASFRRRSSPGKGDNPYPPAFSARAVRCWIQSVRKAFLAEAVETKNPWTNAIPNHPNPTIRRDVALGESYAKWHRTEPSQFLQTSSTESLA